MSEIICREIDEYVFEPTGEEIVRCRDCRHYREEWNRKLMRDTVYCEWLDGSHVEPDGFCAWGVRREVGE